MITTRITTVMTTTKDVRDGNVPFEGSYTRVPRKGTAGLCTRASTDRVVLRGGCFCKCNCMATTWGVCY